MEESMSQQKPTPLIPQVFSLPVTTQMNNEKQHGVTADFHDDCEEDCIEQLVNMLRNNLKISTQDATSLQGAVVNSVRKSSYGAFLLAGLRTQHMFSHANPDASQTDSKGKSNDELTGLASCLGSTSCDDILALCYDFTNLSLKNTEGEKKAKSKRSTSKISLKKSLGRPKTKKTEISKKGKPELKLGNCPYDECGKVFERRYNLRLHIRRHSGQNPFSCPKTEEGCFLGFKWVSSLCHHLETVHNGLLPNAKNDGRGTPTAIPISPASSPCSDNIPRFSSNPTASSGSPRAANSSKLGVSKASGIRKTTLKRKGKVRDDFPVLAVRHPTAEDLAMAQILEELNSGGQGQVIGKEAPAPLTNSSSESDDILEVLVLYSSDEEKEDVEEALVLLSSDEQEEETVTTSGSAGASESLNAHDVMDIDFRAELELSPHEDQPDPHEVFLEEDN